MSTKAEDTQKNILDTARKHFLKDGLTGASLRNIVKDAGLTTGAFYKYYPTKEALFDALTDPYMEHIYQIYDQIVEEFEKLSASDQTRNMSDTSSDGMEQMVEDVYKRQLLIQRKRIHIDYGIIGSSDMDEAGNLVAKIQASMVVPFMYKMIHTGALPKFMQKKLNKTDEVKKELYNGFLNMFGIGKGGCPWITKQSIYNQFYSDLVTKVQHGIDVPGLSLIHIC